MHTRADLVPSQNIAKDKGRFKERGGLAIAQTLCDRSPHALTAQPGLDWGGRDREVTGAHDLDWTGGGQDGEVTEAPLGDRAQPNHGKGPRGAASSFSHDHTHSGTSSLLLSGHISQLTVCFHKNTWGEKRNSNTTRPSTSRASLEVTDHHAPPGESLQQELEAGIKRTWEGVLETLGKSISGPQEEDKAKASSVHHHLPDPILCGGLR